MASPGPRAPRYPEIPRRKLDFDFDPETIPGTTTRVIL